jgi:HEAT repeat protein
MQTEPADRHESDSPAAGPFETLLTPGIEPEEWDGAHQQLLELGSKAVPFLIRKLNTGNEIERETAATTLALIGPGAEEAVPVLVEALNDPADFVRANAAAALVQFPDQHPRAARVLVSLLKSSDPHLRQMAGMNLSALDGEAELDVDELAGILEAETAPEVLVPVVELLGRIGPAAGPAVPKLRQIAFDQPGDAGTAAAQAIQLITTESPVDP